MKTLEVEMTPQEMRDYLLAVTQKLDEQCRNMRKTIQAIIDTKFSLDDLSVCDNCEAEMPVTWLEATDGICVFCGKMHTEDEWLTIQ